MSKFSSIETTCMYTHTIKLSSINTKDLEIKQTKMESYEMILAEQVYFVNNSNVRK